MRNAVIALGAAAVFAVGLGAQTAQNSSATSAPPSATAGPREPSPAPNAQAAPPAASDAPSGASDGAAPASAPASSAPTSSSSSASLPTDAGRKITVIDKVLVRVNGEIFTESQLVRKQIEALRDKNVEVDDPKALQDDAKLGALLQQVTPQVLVDAIDELLLVQRGHELDIKFTDDRFKDAVDSLKKDRGWSDKDLAEALKESDMTMDDLRQGFERSYIIKQVEQQELGSRMQVTEEEERQYYNEHKNELIQPATVTFRELLVAVHQQRTSNGQLALNVGEDNDAKAKADALKARAVKGEDFTALVKEASDSSSKSTGGLVGPVKVDDLNSTVAGALAKLQPGQVSDPLRVPQGYQLLQLESRAAAGVPPFDQVRDQVEQKILDARMGTEVQKLLERLRAQALIQWKDDNLRLVYEKQIHDTAKPNSNS